MEPRFTGTYYFVLSGEELLQQIKRQPELPQRGGFKEYEPDGSWLQNKRLEAFNQERRDVLLEERVQKMYVITCSAILSFFTHSKALPCHGLLFYNLNKFTCLMPVTAFYGVYNDTTGYVCVKSLTFVRNFPPVIGEILWLSHCQSLFVLHYVGLRRK